MWSVDEIPTTTTVESKIDDRISTKENVVEMAYCSIINKLSNEDPVLIFKNDDVYSKFPIREINLKMQNKCKIGCEKKRKKELSNENNMLFDIDTTNLGYEHGYFFYDHFTHQVKK